MKIYQVTTCHYLDRTVLRPRDVWDELWSLVEKPKPTFMSLELAKKHVETNATKFVATWLEQHLDDETPPSADQSTAVTWLVRKTTRCWRGTLKQFDSTQWFGLIHEVELQE